MAVRASGVEPSLSQERGPGGVWSQARAAPPGRPGRVRPACARGARRAGAGARREEWGRGGREGGPALEPGTGSGRPGGSPGSWGLAGEERGTVRRGLPYGLRGPRPGPSTWPGGMDASQPRGVQTGGCWTVQLELAFLYFLPGGGSIRFRERGCGSWCSGGVVDEGRHVRGGGGHVRGGGGPALAAPGGAAAPQAGRAAAMIYDVGSPLFRSFLAVTGGAHGPAVRCAAPPRPAPPLPPSPPLPRPLPPRHLTCLLLERAPTARGPWMDR